MKTVRNKKFKGITHKQDILHGHDSFPYPYENTQIKRTQILVYRIQQYAAVWRHSLPGY